MGGVALTYSKATNVTFSVINKKNLDAIRSDQLGFLILQIIVHMQQDKILR